MELLDLIENIAKSVREIAPTIDALALAEEVPGSGVATAMPDVDHAAGDQLIHKELLRLGTGQRA